jgi:hypothetical protein
MVARRIPIRCVTCFAIIVVAAASHGDVIGKVKTIDQSGITLDIGPKLPWGTRLSADQRRQIQQQLPVGSLARIVLESGRIVSARITSVTPAQVTETSLTALKPYAGGYSFQPGHSFWGFVPTHTGFNRGKVQTIYQLGGGYDFFRFKFCFSQKDGPGKLYYRLDGGEPVVTSIANTELTSIVIDVRGVQSIQLWAEGQTGDTTGTDNFIIDPILAKLPSSIPVLASPANREKIEPSEELRWRPVADAVGYRVELECVRLYDTSDANRQRFFSIQTTSEVRAVKLADLNLPAGEYRWRVHSLNEIGVMGQMAEWWTFTIDLDSGS